MKILTQLQVLGLALAIARTCHLSNASPVSAIAFPRFTSANCTGTQFLDDGSLNQVFKLHIFEYCYPIRIFGLKSFRFIYDGPTNVATRIGYPEDGCKGMGNPVESIDFDTSNCEDNGNGDYFKRDRITVLLSNIVGSAAWELASFEQGASGVCYPDILNETLPPFLPQFVLDSFHVLAGSCIPNNFQTISFQVNSGPTITQFPSGDCSGAGSTFPLHTCFGDSVTNFTFYFGNLELEADNTTAPSENATLQPTFEITNAPTRVPTAPQTSLPTRQPTINVPTSCTTQNRTVTEIVSFLQTGTCTCPRPFNLATQINCPISTLQQCESEHFLNPSYSICLNALSEFQETVLNCITNPCRSDCDCGQVAIDFLGSNQAKLAAPQISGFFSCLEDNGCADLSGIPGGEENVRTLLNSTSCPEQLSFFETAFNADLGSCSLSCPTPSAASGIQVSVAMYALPAAALYLLQVY